MAKVTSVQEIFENLDEGFQPDKAEGVDAIFQFDLTGDNGAKYWVKVQDKQAEVNEGEHDAPTMVLTSSADDYIAIVNGELAPMTAFMQGRVRVKGDMGLAMKLQAMFGL
jgi:putative sterol carrier protein